MEVIFKQLSVDTLDFMFAEAIEGTYSKAGRLLRIRPCTPS